MNQSASTITHTTCPQTQPLAFSALTLHLLVQAMVHTHTYTPYPKARFDPEAQALTLGSLASPHLGSPAEDK